MKTETQIKHKTLSLISESLDSLGKIHNGRWRRNFSTHPECVEFLKRTFPFLKQTQYTEYRYYLENDITTQKKCTICGVGIKSKVKICKSKKCQQKFVVLYNKENVKEISDKQKLAWGNFSKEKLSEIEFKKKITCLERYGVDNPMKKEEFLIKNKIKSSFNEKERQRKHKETLLERYGVENISCIGFVKEKKKCTMNHKYGVDNPMKLIMNQQKAFNTRLERYGDYHNPKTSYGWKDYYFESGRKERIQGWEDKGLDTLLKTLDEDSIMVHGVEPQPYTYQGTERNFFPDFKINGIDLYIEVKSDYTLMVDYERNLLKFLSCNVHFYIYTGNELRILKTIKDFESFKKEYDERHKTN